VICVLSFFLLSALLNSTFAAHILWWYYQGVWTEPSDIVRYIELSALYIISAGGFAVFFTVLKAAWRHGLRGTHVSSQKELNKLHTAAYKAASPSNIPSPCRKHP